jgi:proteasome lid subunit RPN8/RPN11
MLAIREGLVRETLQTLQECGRRQGGECVVLWIADRDQPDIVSAARHPEHHSSRKGYEIASEWMHTLWVQLSDAGQRICAQVHTHPGPAFHSPTDDEFPAVHLPGFVSIVVPNLARPPVRPPSIHVSVLQADGWRQSSLSREVSCV